jgi:hypothetical protein
LREGMFFFFFSIKSCRPHCIRAGVRRLRPRYILSGNDARGSNSKIPMWRYQAILWSVRPLHPEGHVFTIDTYKRCLLTSVCVYFLAYSRYWEPG